MSIKKQPPHRLTKAFATTHHTGSLQQLPTKVGLISRGNVKPPAVPGEYTATCILILSQDVAGLLIGHENQLYSEIAATFRVGMESVPHQGVRTCKLRVSGQSCQAVEKAVEFVAWLCRVLNGVFNKAYGGDVCEFVRIDHAGCRCLLRLRKAALAQYGVGTIQLEQGMDVPLLSPVPGCLEVMDRPAPGSPSNKGQRACHSELSRSRLPRHLTGGRPCQKEDKVDNKMYENSRLSKADTEQRWRPAAGL